jgi:hypothetical protein
MIWLNFAKRYLGAFAAKDLDYLDSVYSDEIELSDWEGTTKGKEQVLTINKHFFDNVDLISFHVKDVAYNNKLIFICFDAIITSGKEKDQLTIVDMIKIDNNGKIQSVNAFKK